MQGSESTLWVGVWGGGMSYILATHADKDLTPGDGQRVMAGMAGFFFPIPSKRPLVPGEIYHLSVGEYQLFSRRISTGLPLSPKCSP